MKNPFRIFKISKEERWPSVVILLYLLALNALAIYQHFEQFTKCGNLGFYTIFTKNFCLSGFDPYTYITLSQWRSLYVLSRHPLLAIFVYPFSELNQWLMDVTDMNCAVFIVAVVLVLLSLYSFLFLFRILRQIVEIGYKESLLLCTFFFSFAYIMVTVVAPDHFGLSLFFLLLTLYIAGRSIKDNKKMPSWATALLFLLSTGITTTNCVKIGLAQWFANGRRVFHPRSFLIAFILPSCLLVGSYLLIDEYIQKPEQERRDNALQERLKDPKFKKDLEAFHRKQDKAHANAIMSGETFRWTDMKLSRSRSIVENLFGESLMFHDEKMLHDVNVDRPVFVAYTNYFCYVIVGIVLLLFILGIACGIKSHFFLLCLSWFGFDMFLHLVLGFGLQEVYIMTAHWAFIIPIAIAYTFKYFKNVEYQQTLKYIVLFLTIFLVTYNWNLYIHYMLS